MFKTPLIKLASLGLLMVGAHADCVVPNGEAPNTGVNMTPILTVGFLNNIRTQIDCTGLNCEIIAEATASPGEPDILVGRTVIGTKTQTTVAIWGDDSSTLEKDGAGPDEVINLHVVDDSGVLWDLNVNGVNGDSLSYQINAAWPLVFSDITRCTDTTADIQGCTEADACNFNADATEDDGTCAYAVENYDCDGACLNDEDNDQVCDELEVPGCTDASACNFNADADATDDDGSCTYADTVYDCDGNCLADADEDGVCDENETGGCTNKRADNYNSAATQDDGSCTMPGGTAAEQKRKRGKNFAKSQLSKVNDMLGESADSIMDDLDNLAASEEAKPNFGNIMKKLNRRGVEDADLTDDDKKARASLLRAGMAETKGAGKDAMIVPVVNDKLLPKRFKAKLEAANIANLELKYGKQRSIDDVQAIEISTSGTEICGDADIRLDALTQAVEVILETKDSVSLKCSDADTPVSILQLVDDPDATDDLLNYKYKCWEGSAWGDEQSVAQYGEFTCNGIETFVLSDTGTPPEEGYNCDSKEQEWLEQGCACGGDSNVPADNAGSTAWCGNLKTEWQTNCEAAQCSA